MIIFKYVWYFTKLIGLEILAISSFLTALCNIADLKQFTLYSLITVLSIGSISYIISDMDEKQKKDSRHKA